MIRIFCDVVRTIKIRRSIIKLELDTVPKFYVLDDENMILNHNGTAVLVRATTRDLTKIYVFDPKTDSFLGIVKEKIEVYGDIKSMDHESKKDEYAIMRHGKQIKAIETETENRLAAAMAIPDPEEFFDLEVFETK